jgi:hypothetical protein
MRFALAIPEQGCDAIDGVYHKKYNSNSAYDLDLTMLI